METDVGAHIANLDYNGQLPCKISQEGELLSRYDEILMVKIVAETFNYQYELMSTQ